uniref:RRM domain-containing protein n=1 Tax=Clastoptera arizonana TaxID=38151 RepID=A0A1B6CJ55_9HEMI
MSGDPSNLVPPGSMPTTFIPTTSAGNVGYMVMSYSGRPQMVPGIPMPPGMGMPYMPLGGPPPGLMPAVMPMAHPHMMTGPPMAAMPGPPLRQYRPQHTNSTQPPRHTRLPRPPMVPQIINGPTVTVFVGNITEKAPDQMVRHILAACGTVISWKRVQAFGFCEYGSPDAGLRAIRILHEMDIGGKKLVVKVDAKTKTVLDEFKAEKRRKIKGRSPLQDEPEEEDDYIDDEMKRFDQTAQCRIACVLDEYESDMKNFTGYNNKTERTKSAAEMTERRVQRTQERLAQLSQASENALKDGESSLDLDDANIEEGKRDLITREIGKFREIMKG